MKVAPSRPGFERIEAFFQGHAFDPHRHDTYAIGITTYGVQTFGYRGAEQHSTPGQVIVLHPDEKHDGRAGAGTGFRYRMLYIEPASIQEALGDHQTPLPFVASAVNSDPRLVAALKPAFTDLDAPLEDLAVDRITAALADVLSALDRSSVRRRLPAVHERAVRNARDYIDANVEAGVKSDTLERVTGLDRYTLARHFRGHFGTSPYRYLVMRRLDLARSLIRKGYTLCDAALSSGFADQSHMTRHFKNAYGMSPGRWAAFCLPTDLPTRPTSICKEDEYPCGS